MTDYTNAAQQRGYKVLKALAGHDLYGLTISQIAVMVDSNPAQVAKDLANLEIQGLAEKDGERWRHGKAVLEMYRLFANGLKTTLESTLETALSIIKNG